MDVIQGVPQAHDRTGTVGNKKCLAPRSLKNIFSGNIGRMIGSSILIKLAVKLS